MVSFGGLGVHNANPNPFFLITCKFEHPPKLILVGVELRAICFPEEWLFQWVEW